VYQVIGGSDSHDDMDDQQLAEFASRIAPEDVQLFYQTALIGRRDLHLAPDPRSGAEMTLLRMLAFQPGGSPGTGAVQGSRAMAKASATQGRAAAPPATAASSKIVREAGAPLPASAEPATTSRPWQEPDWSALIDSMNLTGASRLLASNCAYLNRAGNVLHLSLDGRSESLLTRSRQEALAAALSKHFNETLRVDIAVGVAQAETPLQAEARISDEKVAAARETLERDPNVRALKDMFGATLNVDSVEVVNGQSSRNQE
jgi:DNA polymerase-3 subunit gamma/tau